MPGSYRIEIKNGKTGALTNTQAQQGLTTGSELDLLKFDFLVTHGNTKFVNAGKLVHVEIPNNVRA